MSEAVIGYAPTDGRLILGQHRDAAGRWVEPIYPDEDMMIVAPTELDRAILGADTDCVIVVWRNDAWAERYRVAADMSWYGVSRQDAAREDDILRQVAQGRFDPDEDNEPFDPRTLAARSPAGRVGPHVDPAARRPPITPRGANGHRPQPDDPTSVPHTPDAEAPTSPPVQEMRTARSRAGPM